MMTNKVLGLLETALVLGVLASVTVLEVEFPERSDTILLAGILGLLALKELFDIEERLD